MEKSIKDIADELGVSKQAIRKEIDNLGLQTKLKKNGNQFVIDKTQETLIKSNFLSRRDKQPKDKPNEKDLHFLISVLEKQLDIKDRQISEKDKQIEDLQNLFNQEQQLRMIEHSKFLVLEDKKTPWWKFGKGEVWQKKEKN